MRIGVVVKFTTVQGTFSNERSTIIQLHDNFFVLRRNLFKISPSTGCFWHALCGELDLTNVLRQGGVNDQMPKRCSKLSDFAHFCDVQVSHSLCCLLIDVLLHQLQTGHRWMTPLSQSVTVADVTFELRR